VANTIVWFDIPVNNLKSATEFYSKLLNKPLQINTEHGFEITVFPHDDNSSDVAGCLYEDKTKKLNDSDLLIYFDVNKRIHDAVAVAKTSGGKVLEEVQTIGPWGYRAVILDCCGNKIALHAMEDK
jgi:predicted enzyme related to lactoylglutathione lyase